MRSGFGTALVVGTVLLATAAPLSAASEAGKPLKLRLGKPYGEAQTNTIVKDPMVDGSVVRIVVTQAGTKPWAAGVNSFIGEKLRSNDRIDVTFWLKAMEPAGAGAPRVAVNIQANGPPKIEFAQKTFTLTSRWAPYTVSTVLPKDMPAHSVMVGLQVAFGEQSVDIGAVTARMAPAVGQ